LLIRSSVGFKTLQELNAYRVARAFKLEVYRLVKSRPAAFNDYRFRSQLFEAAASVEMNIAEGFRRYSAGDFSHFLRISRSSLEEATSRLQDGIDRGYFTTADCQQALAVADEAGRLTVGLIVSLRPFTSRGSRGATSQPRRTQDSRTDPMPEDCTPDSRTDSGRKDGTLDPGRTRDPRTAPGTQGRTPDPEPGTQD
jgi:four helix bundle protein